nr:retrovirus-related Pol polyprotein from transposon TNT 1-94 [Tanacetum cinerariifolium]
MVKNKGLIVEAYAWDEEEVSSDDNEMVEVKVLMKLAEDNDAVIKESARNGEWVNISMRKKWLSFYQSLKHTYHVKDSELASIFGKLKYEENLIDSIYETKRNKSLISTTPLLSAFFSTSIVQDFQDSPDDEEDTRSSHKYLNDLEEEYQARSLLAKSKRFFKRVLKEEVSSDDNETVEVKVLMELAKYNDAVSKEGAINASKASMVKNKGLIVEAYAWDEEEVSSDDNEMVEVKVLMELAKDNDDVSKEGARNGEWALLEDLALYDNKIWNDLRDFTNPVKVISLPQDVLSTFDRHLIELENQVQRLMKAHLTPKQPVQVNKISSSCKIYSGPHDTQYCMENPKQDFVNYASSRTNEAGGKKKSHILNEFRIHLPPYEEELQSKGIKSPSKLLFPKYLYQSSLAKKDRNPSSPKHVHFINSIIILNKEDKAEGEGSMKPSATKCKDHKVTIEAEEEVEEESKEEFKEETEDETEEEEEEDP